MKEELMEKVLQEVRRRQHCALLLGRTPSADLGWEYVNDGIYEAVVIGSLSAHELLHFPNEICTEALLSGKPVFLCEEGLDYRRFSKTSNRALYSRLLSAERQLKQLGVQTVGHKQQKLLTAEDVRRRLKNGQPIEGRLTPLAKDVLEGRA